MRISATGRANLFASAWGFAEASFFIIVPDVFLSWLALRNLRRALIACVFAVLGALAGAALMWLWARHDLDGARSLLVALPAISDDMLLKVQNQLADTGIVALFLGPLSGTPYKVYVVEAAASGHPIAVFLAVSIPARLIRFAAVTVFAGAARLLLQRWLTLRGTQVLHICLWASFYSWYFWIMTRG